jgi:CRP/FNR family cyclic AMP-dependent transcriptional regulator
MINLLWENLFKKEETSQKITKLLQQNKIFSTLTRKEIRIVEELIHERHYRTGETVFRQGEIGIGMYIISKGAVDISVVELDDVTTTENFSEVVITKLKKGDFFGEISLVEDSGKRTAHATVSEDSVLIGFFKPDLNVILQSHPSIGSKITMNLAEVIGRRLKSTTEKIAQLRNEMKTITELYRANENTTTPNKT